MKTKDIIQEEALVAVLPRMRAGLGISMGVGKTLIGLKYLQHYYLQGKRNFLVVAPKLSIFQSWKDDADKFGLVHLLKEITFTSYLSLNKQDHYYDVVILDECHSLKYNHEAWLTEHKDEILGLTGTPPRYDRSEKGYMVSKFCPIVYRYIVGDAVDDKILNDYRIKIHMIPLSTARTQEVKRKDGNVFYTSEKANYDYWTNRLMNASSKKEENICSVMRMRAMMDFQSKEDHAQHLLGHVKQKCIVFANTQDQADRLCAYSYHSGNEQSERNLDWFKNNKIIQMSCVMQLNEGVTIPDLREGIILHAYGNERKSNQRIGRLLRLNPTETATIHILCYENTVDEHKWLPAALADLDETKIEYLKPVKQSSWA